MNEKLDLILEQNAMILKMLAHLIESLASDDEEPQVTISLDGFPNGRERDDTQPL